jgi:hypothetical protein
MVAWPGRAFIVEARRVDEECGRGITGLFQVNAMQQIHMTIGTGKFSAHGGNFVAGRPVVLRTKRWVARLQGAYMH